MLPDPTIGVWDPFATVNGKLTLLLVYVDDIILAGNDEFEKNLRKELATQFEVRTLES